MADLQDIDMPDRASGERRVEDARLGVPGEQHALVPVASHHHDARLVRRRVEYGRDRPDDVEREPADGEPVSRRKLAEFGRTGVVAKVADGARVLLERAERAEDLRRVYHVLHSGQTTEVVLV